MRSLPDLATPFALVLLYDREALGGFRVLWRENRRWLLGHRDGTLMWAYLRQWRWVVRTETLRGEAARRLVCRLVQPVLRDARISDRLWGSSDEGAWSPLAREDPSRRLDDALRGESGVRCVGRIASKGATSYGFEFDEGKTTLVATLDPSQRLEDARWLSLAEGEAWARNASVNRLEPVRGSVVGGAPLTVLVLTTQSTEWLDKAFWHSDTRLIHRSLDRDGLEKELIGGSSELAHLLTEADRSGTPVTAIVTDVAFGETSRDVALLRRIGEVCAQHAVAFIADASPSLLGHSEKDRAAYVNATRVAEVFRAESHQAFAAFRKQSHSRWIALAAPRGCWGAASFMVAAHLHDAFVSDGWCANIANRGIFAVDSVNEIDRVVCFGARAEHEVNELGVIALRVAPTHVALGGCPSLHCQADDLPTEENSESETTDFGSTLLAARILHGLRNVAATWSVSLDLETLNRLASDWLSELVVATDGPLGRGRVAVTKHEESHRAALALLVRRGDGFRWVRLTGEFAVGATREHEPLAAGAPRTSVALLAPPSRLLRDRVRLCLPANSLLHAPLGRPGALWRVDSPIEPSWHHAARAVVDGATPEFCAAEAAIGDITLWVTVEASPQALRAYRVSEAITPWELPRESAMVRQLGVCIASRVVDGLRLAVSSIPGAPRPPWLTDYANRILSTASPGWTCLPQSFARLMVDDQRTVVVPVGHDTTARILIEDQVTACQLTGVAHELTIYALDEAQLHLPYMAPEEPSEVTVVLGQRVVWRRDTQVGRTVRDGVVGLGQRCLYMVSHVDDPSLWQQHQRILEGAQLVGNAAAVSDDTPEAPPGFELAERLGRGGAAEVHRVHHFGWAMDLALKTPRVDHTAEGASSSRFPLADTLANEAEAWTKLQPHPNVVSCYQARRHRGVPHIFVELVEGGTLSEWIASGRLYAATGDGSEFSSAEIHRQASAFARIVDIGIQVAFGLHHAHLHGLIHQDVKPANVLLTDEGVAKVTDFGLVNAATTEHAVEVGGTMVATFGGFTPAYCSPEQAAAEPGHQLTRRTDVWSWAVMMLEMFCGKVTWRFGALAPIVLDELMTHGPSSALPPPLSADLGQLLRHCLTVHPDDRPHDMLEVAVEAARIYHHTLGNRYPRRAPRPADGRADVLNNRGASLMDLSRPMAATSAWEEALRLEPMHLEAGYNLALHRHRSLGSSLLGLQMERLLCAHPRRWEASYALAWTHVERGDTEASEAAATQAIALGAPPREMVAVREASRSGKARLGLVRMATQSIQRPLLWQRLGDAAVGVITRSVSHEAASSAPHNVVFRWSILDNAVVRRPLAFDPHVLAASANGCWIAGLSFETRATTVMVRWELRAYQPSDLALAERIDLGAWHARTEARAGDAVTSLAVDGSDIFVGRADGRLERWDLNRRTRVGTHALFDVSIQDICVAHGRVLCTSASGEARLLEREAFSCIDAFEIGNRERAWLFEDSVVFAGREAWSRWDITRRRRRDIESTAGLRDCSHGRLLEASDGGTLRLWDVDRGALLVEATPRAVDVVLLAQGGGTSLAAYADGVAVAYREGRSARAPWLVVRPRSSEQLLEDEVEYDDALNAARHSLENGNYPTAARLVGRAGSVVGYQRAPELFGLRRELAKSTGRGVARGALLRFVPSTTEWVRVAISHDGSRLLTLDPRGQTALWSLPPSSDGSAAELEDVMHASEVVKGIALSRDGKRAVTLTVTQRLTAWHWHLHEETSVQHGACRRFALSADGRWATVVDQRLRLLNLDSHEWIDQSIPVDGLSSLATSHDGGQLVAGYHDGTLIAWRTADDRLIWQRLAHRRRVHSVAISDDVAVSSAEDTIVSDGASGKERYPLPWEVRRPSLSTADLLTCIRASDDMAVVWDLASGAIAHELTAATDIALTGDGTCAITCSSTGMSVWELDWERVT